LWCRFVLAGGSTTHKFIPGLSNAQKTTGYKEFQHD
jgi:hypothetical protein